MTDEDVYVMENGINPFLIHFFLFFPLFFLFIHFRLFRLRSWRIKLYEWHSQRGPRASCPRVPALFFPRYSTSEVSHFRYCLALCTNEVEEDEVRMRKLKAFSCVSDPRCERSSPAALSCSLWCHSSCAYESSCSLEQTMKKKTRLYTTN